MEDFGNWIYIVVIIGAVVASLFKKKPEENPPPRTQQPQPFDTEEEPWVLSPTPFKEQIVKPRPEVIPDKRNLFTPMARPSLESPFSQVEEEAEGVDLSIDIENADEFKKGIIYAEVLNRKYC